MNDFGKAEKVYLGPVVTIFVRHSADCPYKGDELFRRCNCWKHLRWYAKDPKTGKGRLNREQTGSRTWAGADRKKREKEIELDPSHVPATHTLAETSTIKDALKVYLSAKESENLTKSTRRKLAHQLGLFEDFMAKRGRFSVRQITKEDVIAFRATWTSWESGVTRQKAQQNLRGFLRSCCPDAQQLKDLLDNLKPIKLSRQDKDRLEPQPYTEEEIVNLLKQIPVTFKDDPDKGTKLTALVHLQVATGLAIRDAIQLERAQIGDGWLRIKRQKTGRPVRQRLDPELHKELLGVANSNPRFVFWSGKTLPESTTGLVQEDFRTLMKAAELYIKGNLSHRFRDTAVDYWLGQGWTLTDVADALGDTVAVVERHYKSLASKRTEERFAKLPVRSFSKGGGTA